jgi:hypothetical protein
MQALQQFVSLQLHFMFRSPVVSVLAELIKKDDL